MKDKFVKYRRVSGPLNYRTNGFIYINPAYNTYHSSYAGNSHFKVSGIHEVLTQLLIDWNTITDSFIIGEMMFVVYDKNTLYEYSLVDRL